MPSCHTSIKNGVLMTRETIYNIVSENKAWSKYYVCIMVSILLKEKYVPM